jgi:hypothetical protein
VDTGSVIAVIAIVIAGGALAVSGYSAWLGRKANQRAERLEKRASEANPLVTSRGTSGSGEETVYSFDVTNDGPATITHVHLWIADHAGDPISTGDTKDQVLKAGEFVPLAVKLVNPERQGRVVWLRWRDSAGGGGEKPYPDIYVYP